MVETVGNQGGGSPVGARLRSAREAKGLSLQEVATQTRIPIRHLEHIEKGEWDALPAATYSVGFARSYATSVGLDAAEVGQELRQELGIARNPSSSPALSFYEPADPARVPPRSIATIAVVLIVLIVGGYLFWRSQAVGDTTPEPQLVETQAPAAQPKAAGPQPQQAAPATGPVVLTAIEDVWLRIYEANGGPSLYQGTLKAGERYEVPAGATAPQIRTGRPQALRVTVGATQIPPLGAPEKTISNVSLRAADLSAFAQGQPAPGAAPATPAPGAAPAPAPAAGAAATPED
jgi:transcriptional regulator with XRE-family HTH domain